MKMTSKYNRSEIMTRAWASYRGSNGSKTFSECLKSVWMLKKVQVAMAKLDEDREKRLEDKHQAFEDWKSNHVVQEQSEFDIQCMVRALNAEKGIRGNAVYWGD